jgi:hypothetical protein
MNGDYHQIYCKDKRQQCILRSGELATSWLHYFYGSSLMFGCRCFYRGARWQPHASKKLALASYNSKLQFKMLTLDFLKEMIMRASEPYFE